MTDSDSIEEIEWRKIVDGIERRIIEATENEEIDHVWSALTGVMIFFMSTVCPDCRKNIARQLKRGIPGMLATANMIAATGPTPPEHGAH